MKIKYNFILLLCFFASSLVAQNNKTIDSLEVLLKTSSVDTVKINIFNRLAKELAEKDPLKAQAFAEKALMLSETVNIPQYIAESYEMKALSLLKQVKYSEANSLYAKSLKLYNQTGNQNAASDVLIKMGDVYVSMFESEKALEYYQKALVKSVNSKNKKNEASALAGLGDVYYRMGENIKALDAYQKSLAISESLKYDWGIANMQNSLGMYYFSMGDHSKSLDFLLKSLALREKIKDKKNIAESKINISNVYISQGDFDKGIKLNEEALVMLTEVGDKRGMAVSNNNIGFVLQQKGDIKKGIEYFTRAKAIYEEIDYKQGIALSFNNIGFQYKKLKEYDKSLDYFFKALEIYNQIPDKIGITQVENNIGRVYKTKKDFIKAEDHIYKSYSLAKELGYPKEIKEASWGLYDIYKMNGRYKEALEMHVIFTKMKDSLTVEANKKATIRQQMQFEFRQKTVADSIQVAKEKEVDQAMIFAQNEQLKREGVQRYALYGGLLLMLIFIGFIYNRFKVSQKQKAIIEYQKNVVDEKQKEIIDSIRYAQRIQKSLLPTEKYIDNSITRLKS